ncbi:MAG: hypothetical protein ACOH2H_06690 [Cypionkella sp.]
MPLRCGLLVLLTDSDGASGWGEAGYNYPVKGNPATLALLQDPLAQTVADAATVDWYNPRPARERRLHPMILCTGEPGPFPHLFASRDTALTGIVERRAGLRLAAFPGPSDDRSMQFYASSPGTARVDDLAAEPVAAGHIGTKIRVGFAGADAGDAWRQSGHRDDGTQHLPRLALRMEERTFRPVGTVDSGIMMAGTSAPLTHLARCMLAVNAFTEHPKTKRGDGCSF